MARGMVGMLLFHPTWSMIPPADRQALTHWVLKAELGKPVFLPVLWDSWPKGRLMEVRVEEAGESECQSVMGWIRVLNWPGSKESRLPARCWITGNVLERITVLVWKMISFYDIDGRTGYVNSILKDAYREVSKDLYFIGGCVTMPYQCLSRMRWKSHVRFLGGLGVVTSPGYPTPGDKTLPGLLSSLL